MTQQEARCGLEASTRFEVRGSQVWLRELRWLRAVELQRTEEALSPVPARVDPVSWIGCRHPSPAPAHRERRAVPGI